MEIRVIDYIEYNSVVTLTMFFISLFTLGLNYITKGKSNQYLFSTKRTSLLNPMTYIRFFTHILGHSNWKHFSNNYLKILLLGPLIEEKYGSIDFLIMIFPLDFLRLAFIIFCGLNGFSLCIILLCFNFRASIIQAPIT